MFYLYASFTHKYHGEKVALINKYRLHYEAAQSRDIETQAWSDEGIKFSILWTYIDPPYPNISYSKLQEMVMK